jgi:hypothetical protein
MYLHLYIFYYLLLFFTFSVLPDRMYLHLYIFYYLLLLLTVMLPDQDGGGAAAGAGYP